jgi:hypothetical protein
MFLNFQNVFSNLTDKQSNSNTEKSIKLAFVNDVHLNPDYNSTFKNILEI